MPTCPRSDETSVVLSLLFTLYARNLGVRTLEQTSILKLRPLKRGGAGQSTNHYKQFSVSSQIDAVSKINGTTGIYQYI